jgi:hypothetical protein
MGTTNKHYGNVLSKLTDRDIKEVFEQWAFKMNISESSLISRIQDMLFCDKFNERENNPMKLVHISPLPTYRSKG